MDTVERTVDQLIEMGYLKYVPQSAVKAVREQLLDSLRHGFLDSEWDDRLVSADKRTYPADSEELAEGRTGEFILLMKEVLQAEGIGLQSVEEDFHADRYDVVINGQRHRIYDRSVFETGWIWVVATKRFLEIVSGLLQEAGSQERLYGIYGGNDGRCILLTDEMYSLLKSPSLKIAPGWMPYPSTALRGDGSVDQ